MENKTEKILYLITKSNFGGAQRYVYDLAVHLPRGQFESTVAFGGNGELKNRLQGAGIKTIEITALERDIGIFRDVAAFFGIFRAIKETRPAVVHINSSKAGLLGVLAVFILNLHHKLTAKNHKTKVVFTAHGWAFKEKRRPLLKKLIEYASWFTILLSDTTIVVSRDDAEKIKRFLFVRNKIKIIHNGIEPIAFLTRDKARETIAAKIGVKNTDGLWIGSIAELHKNKGLLYALAAISALWQEKDPPGTRPRILYAIVGDGEDRDELETFIHEHNLTDTVFLAGPISNAAELLQAFDLFIIPSLKEGLPYVLLEAGSAGLAIVATNVGGVPEVIDDMRSGIVVKAKRPREIGDALQFLINHPDKQKEFGEYLKQTVNKDFTLAIMLTRTVAIYNSLLGH